MRPIDADDYKRILNGWLVELHSGGDDVENAAGSAIFDCICQLDDAPTIDPVHAAGGCRCGECKWFGPAKIGGGWCNEVMARPMPYDGFCSYGEPSLGNKTIKDTAGYRVLNRKHIVTGRRRAMDDWISVKVRLPKDNERVLAYRPNEDITYSMVPMWGWALRSAAKRGVTHWMPLPQPPREADHD